MKQERYILDSFEQEILDSCKMQMKIHVTALIDRGIRSANIQIELESYLRSLLVEK